MLYAFRSGESRSIIEIDNPTMIVERHFSIIGDELLFMTTDMKTWTYRMNIKTAKLTKINYDNLTKSWSVFDSNSGYIYGCNQAGSLISENWYFCASDLNGNELSRTEDTFLPKSVELLVTSYILTLYITTREKR